ncbi:MAG: AcrR family transcriptional regulator [Bradymonadia bacterium]
MLDAVLERLSVTPLEQISIRACCEQVGVSEPTFFNYFGSRAGALVFFVQLWSIEAQWHLARSASGRDGIAELFERTASVVRKTRWLLPEIITYQFRMAAPHGAGLKPVPPATVGDKLLAFPDLLGVDSLEPRPVQHLVRDAISRAQGVGDLGPAVDLALLERLVLALFFGAAASNPDAELVADTMSRGLTLIWPTATATELQ